MASSLSPKATNTLRVGNEDVNIQAVSAKVKQDILFLRDRIRLLKSQSSPNKTILNTYESMLKSRESVLHWLKESSPYVHDVESDLENTKQSVV